MEGITLVSHGDADGIVSVALALKKFREEKPRIYFTTPVKLGNTLANLISKNQSLDKVFIFDLAANEKTILLSSAFPKATWIDHHRWEIAAYPPNVEVINDIKSASAAELVAKYFDVSSELVGIANQIDRNEIKSGEAEFLRDFIGALKWRYNGALLYSKFLSLSKTLSFDEGLAKLEQNMSIARLIDSYLKFLKKMEETILQRVKIFKINGKKVAFYETTKFIPMYLLTQKLLSHKDAPFDIIVGLARQIDRLKRRISTKLELRTHGDEDVYIIAKEFGGGGHKVAAAAVVRGFLTMDAVLEKIKELKK